MLKRILIVGFVFTGSLMVLAQQRNRVGVKDTITDKSIVVPEAIDRNFDQLLVDWKKEYKYSPDCNTTYNGNVSYMDSVYIGRLYALPTEMELVYNSIVRSYIDMYTGRQHRSVELFLGKSKYYFPIFEEALDRYGLPLELKYLPIIESALNPTIVSRAGATGLWQFMIGTGKMYDLEINSLVDERRDPIKSSDAAARFLKDLHSIYGDWNLVIAAYNCGPGNVNKAIKRAGGKKDYWEIYEFLPRETRGYVPAFIAATYAMNYSKEHDICPIDFQYNYSTDTIQVDKYMHLQQLSEVLDVSIDVLREMNPQFKKDIVPGEFKAYTLVLPSMKASDFVINKDTVYAYRVNEFLTHRKTVEPSGFSVSVGGIKYKVRRSDNLAGIAKKYGTTTAQLKSWNNLRSKRLRTGQYLVVALPSPEKDKQAKSESDQNQYLAQNTSKRGVSDLGNLEGGSNDGNTKPSMLSQYFDKVKEQSNNLTTDKLNIEVDDDDEVSDTGRSRDLQGIQTIYHKVRIGETMAQIATKYQVDRKDIQTWNNLKSSIPKTGQRLIIHLSQQDTKNAEVIIVEQVDEKLVEEVIAQIKAEENKTSPTSVETVHPDKEHVITMQPEVRVSRKTVVAHDSPAKEETKPKPKAKAKQALPALHIVRKGDTLGHIAAKYGNKITPKDLVKANKLTTDKLSLGQKIKIPNR